MCGIVGKLHLIPGAAANREEIERMMRPISHRGPDGQGFYLDGPVGFGHLRLAIIDVDGGPQPMTNEDGTVWIVFNGEIYNFQGLREDLVARGHKFRSRSDTEVIIHLYEEYGDDCVRHLRGMFAFAIWDAKRQRLFVARDRVGIKPLYYCQTRDALFFASEFKGIVADPSVPRDVNLPALRQFFSFYYLPGEETLFSSVHKLAPGHTLAVENGKLTMGRYWDLQFTEDRWNRTFEEVVEELHGLLGSTVRDHMIADVPVGVLLSGGVDSSAVLNFAVQGTEKTVKAFTIGFDGNQVVDERPFARMAARQFGAEHYELSITAEDFWKFLPGYVWHMEEPVCEPPAIALHYISELARQHVKVVLSGEGGDEAFAGYPNYPHMLRLERIRRTMGPLARPVGAISGSVGNLLGFERMARYGHALGRSLGDHYFSRTSTPTATFNRQAHEIFSPSLLAATSDNAAAAFMAGLLQPVKKSSLLDQMLYADTKTWLPDDLLVKADKITMASSLELRVPLLDHKVLEFAASLPQEYKVRGKETKRALKAAFAKILPQEILTRKKAGFPVPYSRWLSGPLAPRVREIILSEKAKSRGYFVPKALDRLVDSHERTHAHPKAIFSLLVVELWHRQFVDSA